MKTFLRHLRRQTTGIHFATAVPFPYCNVCDCGRSPIHLVYFKHFENATIQEIKVFRSFPFTNQFRSLCRVCFQNFTKGKSFRFSLNNGMKTKTIIPFHATILFWQPIAANERIIQKYKCVSCQSPAILTVAKTIITDNQGYYQTNANQHYLCIHCWQSTLQYSKKPVIVLPY